MAAAINKRDVYLLAATPRTVSVNLGTNVNVDGTVAGVSATTVKNNAATAAAHAASSGNPHGVSLTQISGDLDDIGDGATYFRTTSNQVTGAGRGFNALNSSNEYIKSLKSTQLTLVGSNPSTGWVGDANGIRMYQSSVLKVNLPVSGDPFFIGDITGDANINITGQGRFSGNDGGYSIQANYSQVTGVGGVRAYSKSSFIPAIRAECLTSGGISVDAVSNSSGVTALECTNNVGGTALKVSGPMTISSTNVVSNLNADMVDGKHASSLCQIVVTDSGTCTVSGNGFNLNCTVSGVGTLGSGNVVTIRPVSDRNLKEDISPEKLGLDFINALTPVSYRYKKKPEIQYHGFIAQDVEKLITDTDDSLFQVHSDGVKGTDYMSLLAPVVLAVQQLSKKFNSIERRY